MPTTGSAHGVSHALEPAVQPLRATVDDGRELLGDNLLEEGLLAGFLLGYRHRTHAAYLADLRDFRAWCTDVGWSTVEDAGSGMAPPVDRFPDDYPVLSQGQATRVVRTTAGARQSH